MFRHERAILSEFDKRQRMIKPTRTAGASPPHFISLVLKIKDLKILKHWVTRVNKLKSILL